MEQAMTDKIGKMTKSISIWEMPEVKQKEWLERLTHAGIPSGQRNKLFVTDGVVFLMMKLYPDSWPKVGLDLLQTGIDDKQKRRERRLWWSRTAVPYYQNALEGKRLYVPDKFEPKTHYRDSDEAGDELERLLGEVILRTSILTRVIYLGLYMLDLQAEAERHGKLSFFRGMVAMARDLEAVYPNMQLLSRDMPFVVSRFRESDGHDLNELPLFRCLAKADAWKEGLPRVAVATEYQLSEEYRYLLDY